MDERFGKEYKLCSKKVIETIFLEGKTVKTFPFVMRYLFTELKTEKAFQIVISVPKSKFKRAVDRNAIKRLTREAVRKRKHLLEELPILKDKQVALFLIYTGREKEPYQKIVDKIEALFLRLVEEIK